MAKTVHSLALFLVYHVLCVKPPSPICATPLHGENRKHSDRREDDQTDEEGAKRLRGFKTSWGKQVTILENSSVMGRKYLAPPHDTTEQKSSMSRRKKRSAFDQVSEFDRGRIVAYRDCGLSFREIGCRVGRNQTTVMRICGRWMQEGTTDRRGRSHLPQCTIITVRAYNSTLFTAEWSARKTSNASYTIDVGPQTNSAMKEGCGRQYGMKLSLLTSHASVFITTMVGFKSGDIV
ncbi:HTH_38 domain-containing protein [Trichonephila clavipes]|nr:HTH_38 domain-containing protein [Trichonephila clavipes]